MPVEQTIVGVLLFVRVGSMMFALPLFGDPPTPIPARILVSLALSLCFLRLVPSNLANVDLSTGGLWLAWYGFREIAIGLITGFAARVAFNGMLMAASLVGYQMGFGTANLFLPDVQEQIDGFSALHRILVLLVFFSLGLHQIFLRGIADSLQLVPLCQVVFHDDLGKVLIDMTAGTFVTALQLAAPIVVALMFTMAGLGLVARAVPQLNVFTMSFPASFFIGLMIYIATFPLFPNWVSQDFAAGEKSIYLVLRGLMP